MKNIKAIIFDMVGVLLFKDNSFKDDYEINLVENEFNHVDDELLVKTLKEKYQFSDAKITEIMQKIPLKYKKFDALFETLTKLKSKYKLAIINNGSALTIPYFKEINKFDKYFDFFINSTEVGVRKPNKEIYLITCNKLGVLPKECIYIDDNLENSSSASDLGMTAFYWNKSIPKEEHLQKLVKLIKI